MASYVEISDPADPRLADYRNLRDVQLRRVPRGRARAVPGRGREGRTTSRAGRLPGPFLPDGAALAGRAGRRHGAAPTHRASSYPRSWRSRSPASTCTAEPWPPWPGPRCPPWTRCSTAPAAWWSARTSSTTPTSARSSAAPPPWAIDGLLLAPRCADPLYRRSVKVAMGAVFTLPWTRLPDWYDALSYISDSGFTTVALTLAADAVPIDEAVAGLEQGCPGPGLGRPWFVRSLGVGGTTIRGAFRCARGSTP